MKIRLIIMVTFASLFVGCNDYLDLVPENDLISTEKIFQKRNSALKFLNSAYKGINVAEGGIGTDPAICGSDEFMGDYTTRKIGGGSMHVRALGIASGLQNASDPLHQCWGIKTELYNDLANNYYVNIRNCNTFIKNIDKVYNMTDTEKAQWKAEAKALKAYYYFQLMKHYGPIVLVSENISVEEDKDDMCLPRQHVDTCFNRIARLFDEAFPDLATRDQLGQTRMAAFSKEAAIAYKAKALTYAASPLFNGNEWLNSFTNKEGQPLFSNANDPKKWERAAKALDEAIVFCESQGRKLIDYHADEETTLLNTIKNVQESSLAKFLASSEAIYSTWSHSGFDINLKLPRYNPDHEMYHKDVFGCLSPTLRMAELFYTENGLPIDMDATWHYDQRYILKKETDSKYKNVVSLTDNVLNLHRLREPRFYANIAFDRGYWKRGNDYVKMKARRGEDHGNLYDRLYTSEIQNLTGYWCKKNLHSTSYGGKTPNFTVTYAVAILRMAELYLLQAEAWNEYEGPSQKVYDAINKVRERAKIPTVEEAWSKYSKTPDFANTKDGMREIIRTEQMIELAFEGKRFWNMRRWLIAESLMNKPLQGWNVFGATAATFYKKPVDIWVENQFVAPRDYFWPIKDEEVMISNVKQNLDW